MAIAVPSKQKLTNCKSGINNYSAFLCSSTFVIFFITNILTSSSLQITEQYFPGSGLSDSVQPGLMAGTVAETFPKQ